MKAVTLAFSVLSLVACVIPLAADPRIKPVSRSNMAPAARQSLPAGIKFIQLLDSGELLSQAFPGADGCAAAITDKRGKRIRVLQFGSGVECDYYTSVVAERTGWAALIDYSQQSQILVRIVSPAGELSSHSVQFSTLTEQGLVDPYALSDQALEIDDSGTVHGVTIAYYEPISARYRRNVYSVSPGTGANLSAQGDSAESIVARASGVTLTTRGNRLYRIDSNTAAEQPIPLKRLRRSIAAVDALPNTLHVNSSGAMLGEYYTADGYQPFVASRSGQGALLECQLEANKGAITQVLDINSRGDLLADISSKHGVKQAIISGASAAPKVNYCVNFRVKAIQGCDRYFQNNPDSVEQTLTFPYGSNPVCTFEATLKDSAGAPLSNKEVVLVAGYGPDREVRVAARTDKDGKALLRYPVNTEETYTWTVHFWRDSEFRSAEFPILMKSL